MGKRQPRPEPITFEEITSAQVGGFDQFLRFRPGEAVSLPQSTVIALPPERRSYLYQVHPLKVYLIQVYLNQVGLIWTHSVSDYGLR